MDWGSIGSIVVGILIPVTGGFFWIYAAVKVLMNDVRKLEKSLSELRTNDLHEVREAQQQMSKICAAARAHFAALLKTKIPDV